MHPIEFHESFLSAGDSTRLFLRSAAFARKAKASVILTHGLGEHSARYLHVGAFFAERGYRLCTYDLRGHGLSHGRRGHINRYRELIDDLDLVAKHYARDGGPVFLYGHSLGAQITLNYLLQRRPAVRGTILASPWLELAYRPSRWKVALAKIMVRFWPAFTQEGPQDDTRLSRDPAFLESIPGAELLHQKISARMYNELVSGARAAREQAAKCESPILLIHGGDDLLTSAEATKAFFEKAVSADKTLKIYPGMRHETHNEIGREGVMALIMDWMDRRCGADSAVVSP